MREVAALVVAQADAEDEDNAQNETVALENEQKKVSADVETTDDRHEFENPYKDNTRNLISEEDKQALLNKMSCGRKTANGIACIFVITLNLVSFVISVGFDMS